MIAPRWRKMLRDMAANRLRTVLVILAIAVGVFGVGSVLTSYAILDREMEANYMATNPAAAVLRTGPLDAEALAAVRAVPGVADVESRDTARVRIKVAEDEYVDTLLFVVPDFSDVRVSTFHREAGAFPPAGREILVERAAMPLLKSKVGGSLTVRSAEAERQLSLAGTVHDTGLAPAWMEGMAYGYVSTSTAEWLGARPEAVTLQLAVARGGLDEAHIRDVAREARQALETRDVRVIGVSVPEPGKHPHAGQMTALLILLGVFGALSLVLGSVLAAGMISALLSRQVREIGVLKAIGATTRQVLSTYVASVLLLGAVAIVLGIPAASAAGRAYAAFATGILNFDIADDSIPAWVFVVESLVGLISPLIACAFPLLRGTRVTVRQAITDQGLSEGRRPSRALSFLGRIRGVDRPLLLSLRNTFRRRGRLVLVLATLALGGAAFMTALNVAASWTRTVENAYAPMRFDYGVKFAAPVSADKIGRIAASAPRGTSASGWLDATVAPVRKDGTDGTPTRFLGVDPATAMLRPKITSGRWLLDSDTDAVVVNNWLLDKEPGLRPGGVLPLRLANGRVVRMRIVGTMQEINPPTVYATYDAVSAAVGTSGKVNGAYLATGSQGRSVKQQLQRAFDREGVSVVSFMSMAEAKKVLADHIIILVSLLMLMSGLIVVVGGLALASTMSVNVLERIREIGVLQAIGATSTTVFKTLVAEGVLIAALSWVLALVLSWPITVAAANTAGAVMFKTPLETVASPVGVIVWLLLAVVLGAGSTLYPAWSASRLTVRQVLSYQ